MITSNNKSISEILKDIDEGKIQLPDFQRGWVWEDNRIKALIASVSNGYPIGAAMFLETGGDEVHFKCRTFEGVDKSKSSVEPTKLVLDGQQRNTSLYRALYCKKVVDTVDFKKKPIKRYYYLNIPTCLDTLTDRVDAVISVPEDKKIKENIGRDIVLDLSTSELEYQNHCFPLNIIFDASATMRWQRQYTRYHNSEDIDNQWDSFYDKIITPMMRYQIPVIELGNDVPKEAVCQVFENVNQGGVSLTVFELVTATFAASNFELRKDWDRIWNELKNDNLISYRNYNSFSGTDFITAITLLSNYMKFTKENGRAVSCKKKDVLKLTYPEYEKYCSTMKSGLLEALKFLREERIFTSDNIPYTTQLIPLSVLFAINQNLWYDTNNRKKLSRWFWSGVFGELYGGANETRYVNDVVGMIEWAKDDDKIPDTISRSNFHATRLQQLYTRNSAAYKGVMALILKEHAKDFIKGTEMDFASYVGEATDIHHIFPADYCMKNNIDRSRWNSVINKTPIYARTNRIIGGYAPSKYLSSIERNHRVFTEDLNKYLESHQINVDAIRSNDFDTYFESRKNALLDLIEKATGKTVSGRDFQENEPMVGLEDEINSIE